MTDTAPSHRSDGMILCSTDNAHLVWWRRIIMLDGSKERVEMNNGMIVAVAWALSSILVACDRDSGSTEPEAVVDTAKYADSSDLDTGTIRQDTIVPALRRDTVVDLLPKFNGTGEFKLVALGSNFPGAGAYHVISGSDTVVASNYIYSGIDSFFFYGCQVCIPDSECYCGPVLKSVANTRDSIYSPPRRISTKWYDSIRVEKFMMDGRPMLFVYKRMSGGRAGSVTYSIIDSSIGALFYSSTSWGASTSTTTFKRTSWNGNYIDSTKVNQSLKMLFQGG